MNKDSFNIFDNLIKEDSCRIIVYYKGIFIKEAVYKVGEDIRNKFSKNAIGQKVFSVFIELAENISNYSAEKRVYEDKDEKGYGTFLITESEYCYKIFAGNVISSHLSSELYKRCERINHSSQDELRQKKIEYREQALKEDYNHNGTNIGLIDIALKSGNRLETSIMRINSDKSFFILSTTISHLQC